MSAAVLALLLAAYGLGMARELSTPWIGLHDWNGAFYSQLARNFLRYPFEMHHAMPLVAVSEAAPPDERSIYATHPAGLVWLLAGAFRLFGESEAVARMTAIIASLISLAVWMRLVERAHGRELAMLTGLVYCVMPMSVYYGRMMNHEAFCLCAMLCALAFWQRCIERGSDTSRRAGAAIGWSAAVILGMAIDWPVALFAGLFSVHAWFEWRRTRLSGRLCLLVWAVFLCGFLTVILHIVHAGLAGRWADLFAIFTSRSASSTAGPTSKTWPNTIENFTWPVMILVAITAIRILSELLRSTRRKSAHEQKSVTQGVDAEWVLHVTGLAWLVPFLRQYQYHAYWVFYLGPLVALGAAIGIQTLRDKSRQLGEQASHGIAGILVLVVLFFTLRETDSLFRRVQCPPEYVAVWQHMRESSPPDERIPLPWDPIVKESFGDYVFRNITPPQMAYYLDRSFEVRRPGVETANPSERFVE